MILKLKIDNELRDQLNNIELFKSIFDNGCYIAGGFVRKLLNLNSIVSAIDLTKDTNSDIDIFCTSMKYHNKLLSYYLDRHISCQRLKTGNATNIWYVLQSPYYTSKSNHKNSNVSLNLQLVSCNMGQPQDVLKLFDLVNCMYAIDGEFLYVHERARQLEQQNMLDINIDVKMKQNIAARIGKYTKNHGYKNLSQNVINALKNVFDELDGKDINNVMRLNVERIFDNAILQEKDIKLFIGYYNTIVDMHGKYSVDDYSTFNGDVFKRNFAYAEIDIAVKALLKINEANMNNVEFSYGDLVILPELKNYGYYDFFGKNDDVLVQRGSKYAIVIGENDKHKNCINVYFNDGVVIPVQKKYVIEHYKKNDEKQKDI